MTADQLLTPDQVSARLQVPVATLRRWRYMREGPRYVKCGRHVRYPPEEVDAYIRAQLKAASRDTR